MCTDNSVDQNQPIKEKIMFRYFSIYFLFLVSLVAVDMLWLLVIAKKMYQDEMGDLMASEPNLVAGFAFYVLYAVGVCVFVIMPALSKQSWFERVYRVLCKRGWDQSLGILPSN
jgi:uncharacterized membrane protein